MHHDVARLPLCLKTYYMRAGEEEASKVLMIRVFLCLVDTGNLGGFLVEKEFCTPACTFFGILHQITSLKFLQNNITSLVMCQI
jgi:hypothetical protein